MEAALRTSPHDPSRFLVVSVVNSRLRLCEVASDHNDRVGRHSRIRYNQISARDKLPNFSAFDWSKTHEDLVALGTQSGEAVVVKLGSDNGGVITDAGGVGVKAARGGYVGKVSAATDEGTSSWMSTYKIHQQRKCNSIAWSRKGYLATGLDRVRNASSLHVYDVGSGTFGQGGGPSPVESRGATTKDDPEPNRRLVLSEGTASVKFFASEPDLLIGGLGRQSVRIFDLREPGAAGVMSFNTRNTHNLSIDPLDENYFVSAAAYPDVIVSVWDRRFASPSNPGTPSESQRAGSIVEIRPGSEKAHLWSLRYSGTKRGTFGLLTNIGELMIVDVSRHACATESRLHAGPPNPKGGESWSNPTFVKATHHLARAWNDETQPTTEAERVTAFDFPTPGSAFDHSVLAMYQDRSVQLIKIPEYAPHVNVTAANELYKNLTAVAKPKPAGSKISQQLAALQNSVFRADESPTNSRMYNSLATESESLSVALDSLSLVKGSSSSRDGHKQLLTMGFPETRLGVTDMLTLLDVQKRRCKEGYLFDCKKNMAILENDPWLVEMWDLIHRLDDMKASDGMVAYGLDLSYFGVYSLWKNSLRKKPNFNRLINVEPPNDHAFAAAVKEIVKKQECPTLPNIESRWMAQRQLCLTICGWNLSKETLRTLSLRHLDTQSSPYKPIILAVFKGHIDLALDLLRHAVTQNLISNISLGAVIASCTPQNNATPTPELRSLTSWMSTTTTDPYLSALLTFYTTQSYTSITSLPSLPLTDRIGIALTHLDDFALSRVIESATADAIASGDIEGLVLTGLDTPALDLFQTYISRFNDTQTAVLALARAHPLYSDDTRWPLWLESYLGQIHQWGLFLHRARFVAQHNLFAVNRRGRSLNPTPGPQVTIRCMNCQLPVARNQSFNSRVPSATDLNRFNHQQQGPHGQQNPTTGLVTAPLPKSSALQAGAASDPASMAVPAPAGTVPGARNQKPAKTSPAANSGTICLKCSAPLPRCAICLLTLGTPDVSKPVPGVGAKESTVAAPLKPGDGEEVLKSLMTFCLACGHGFHAHHAREWFARGRGCAVVDCSCACSVGR